MSDYSYNRRRSADSGVRRYRKPQRKKKRSKLLMILLPIVLIVLAAVVFLGVKVSITKNQASALKDDLEQIIDCTKDKDADGAEKALQLSYEHKERLEENMTGSFWTFLSGIDRVKKELAAGEQLLGIVGKAQDELLSPLITLMKREPLTDLKVGDGGFNVHLINSYLDFVEDIQPELDSLIADLMKVDTESMMGSYVDKYKEKMFTYIDAYDQASALLPLLRAFIGNGEDRLYILAAQNSAEIRASGGFPGSIGTIRIKDGVLTIGDFKGVNKVLSSSISYNSGITDEEINVFGEWIYAPRDACFIPAFDHTAKVWAEAYADYQRENGAVDRYDENGQIVEINEPAEPITYYDEYSDTYYEWTPEYVEYVDGVISMTPAIIQMLLGDVGEITLSDGTVLNGENATRILQHDLYHKYFDDINNTTSTSNKMTDKLFAETAKTVMKEFVSNFEVSKFADYYAIFREAAEKNIVMMWMKDEAEEQLIIDAHVSGKLNDDPENPVAGVYFSLSDPSKLGWYLDITPEIHEPVINDDGSRTYDVTVTLTNIITMEEVYNSVWYLIGNYSGAIVGYLHCFGPAGGYISNMETSNYMYMNEATYEGLDVRYYFNLIIPPGESLVLNYQVTTMPGVETPLKIITTPTLTEYRK